jgi:hypothetical protein
VLGRASSGWKLSDVSVVRVCSKRCYRVCTILPLYYAGQLLCCEAFSESKDTFEKELIFFLTTVCERGISRGTGMQGDSFQGRKEGERKSRFVFKAPLMDGALPRRET